MQQRLNNFAKIGESLSGKMEIIVLAFGQAAEIMEKSEWKFEQISDTNTLREKLSIQFPALSSIKYSIAVNKKIVQENTRLQHMDTVALLPPFSGG